jgi:hypothetical protein
MHRLVMSSVLACALCGCSAAILSTGTDEQSIIRRGTTKSELNQTLGQPYRVDALEPRRIWDMRRPRLELLVDATSTRDAAGKPQFVPPNDEVVEVAYYRYAGVLKRKHDVGESLSLGLMTFGASEVAMTPIAASERSTGREHLLLVWFDRSGKAIAYEWE